MKCCVSTDVGTWTNWLTFEPDPDCFHQYRIGYRTLQPRYRLPASCAARRNFTSGKIPRMRIGGVPLERAVVLKWFYSLNRRNTFVGGKCALSSALLVSDMMGDTHPCPRWLRHVPMVSKSNSKYRVVLNLDVLSHYMTSKMVIENVMKILIILTREPMTDFTWSWCIRHCICPTSVVNGFSTDVVMASKTGVISERTNEGHRRCRCRLLKYIA